MLLRCGSGHWDDIPALAVNRAGSLLTRAVERLSGSAGFELLLGGSGRTLCGGVTVRSGRRHGCTRWWCGWRESGPAEGLSGRGWKRAEGARWSAGDGVELALSSVRAENGQASKRETSGLDGCRRRMGTWRHVSCDETRGERRHRHTEAGRQAGGAASVCASEVWMVRCRGCRVDWAQSW